VNAGGRPTRRGRAPPSVHPKTVVLNVENNGEKLSALLVSTIVEPFQRGMGRIRSDHAGAGLGLAFVTSIAQAHDGSLTLTPAPMEGSGLSRIGVTGSC
jgi:two-component system, OmpR family, sensor histidine kinase VanS